MLCVLSMTISLDSSLLVFFSLCFSYPGFSPDLCLLIFLISQVPEHRKIAVEHENMVICEGGDASVLKGGFERIRQALQKIH